MHCRNRSNQMDDNSIVFIKCGFDPMSEKKFCYNCGVETNEKQIICVKCGVGFKIFKKIRVLNLHVQLVTKGFTEVLTKKHF